MKRVPTDSHHRLSHFRSVSTLAASVSAFLLCVLGMSIGSAQNNQPIAGIEIDAAGVLKMKQLDGRLNLARIAAAKASMDADLGRSSDMRKVSINRLEASLAQRIENGQSADDAMMAMAGLTSIEYVFYYPETKDIVVAGPAEGFFADPTGRVRGVDTGRSTILLEDVVTALRAYAPGQPATSTISVSIDPTKEGLQRMQQFLMRVGGNASRGQTQQIVAGLKNNLGLQTVTFKGVPSDTNFARVLVEADYRMKLIGIGLERPPVRIAAYVDRAQAGAVAANAMERWYFEPNYKAITASPDGLAIRLTGDGVKLVGAGERVGANGQRTGMGKQNRASKMFTSEFTKRYPQLADRVPVYGQLRNLMDVAIAAAYIQQADFYTQSGWDLGVLGD
ncbi:MAG: DUF1598 domain-containing protein, partial [Planctomycetota bacterium]